MHSIEVAQVTPELRSENRPSVANATFGHSVLQLDLSVEEFSQFLALDLYIDREEPIHLSVTVDNYENRVLFFTAR